MVSLPDCGSADRTGPRLTRKAPVGGRVASTERPPLRSVSSRYRLARRPLAWPPVRSASAVVQRAVGRAYLPGFDGRSKLDGKSSMAVVSQRPSCAAAFGRSWLGGGGEREALAVPVLGDISGRAARRWRAARPSVRAWHRAHQSAAVAGPRWGVTVIAPPFPLSDPLPATAGRPLLHDRPRSSYQIRRGRVRGWSPTYSLLVDGRALYTYRKVAYLFSSAALLCLTGWSPTYSQVAQVFGEGRLLIRGQPGGRRAGCGQRHARRRPFMVAQCGAPRRALSLRSGTPVTPRRDTDLWGLHRGGGLAVQRTSYVARFACLVWTSGPVDRTTTRPRGNSTRSSGQTAAIARMASRTL